MSTNDRSFPSTSHVFTLPPAAAAAVFDVMVLDPALATDLIPAGPLRRAEPTGYSPWRVLPATLALQSRWLRPVDVVLELLPWSDQRTELALWTTARPRLPVEPTVAAYAWAAQHALATLAELIITGQPVPGPDRRLRLPATRPADQRIPLELHQEDRQFLVERRGN